MKLSRQLEPSLRIGFTARLMHEPPPPFGPRGKKLQYVEQSFSRLLTGLDALAFMVPELGSRDDLESRAAAYVDDLDGLVLQGGSDISPLNYGQEPRCEDWRGDMPRDLYELALLREALLLGKPVLGICRGAQLINVAFGGTLIQDIPTYLSHAKPHRDPELYDGLQHDVVLERGSRLAELYVPRASYRVTSIHHQAVDRLGDGLAVEARSSDDGVVEAFRSAGDSYVLGVQWHPEFHDVPALMPAAPLMADFLSHCRETQSHRRAVSA